MLSEGIVSSISVYELIVNKTAFGIAESVGPVAEWFRREANLMNLLSIKLLLALQKVWSGGRVV